MRPGPFSNLGISKACDPNEIENLSSSISQRCLSRLHIQSVSVSPLAVADTRLTWYIISMGSDNLKLWPSGKDNAKAMAYSLDNSGVKKVEHGSLSPEMPNRKDNLAITKSSKLPRLPRLPRP